MRILGLLVSIGAYIPRDIKLLYFLLTHVSVIGAVVKVVDFKLCGYGSIQFKSCSFLVKLITVLHVL